MINTVGLSGLAGVMSFAVQDQWCAVYLPLVLSVGFWFIFFCAFSHQKANTWMYILQTKLNIRGRDEAFSVLRYNMFYAAFCFLLCAVVWNWSSRNQQNDCNNLGSNGLWNEAHLCFLLRFIQPVPFQTLFFVFFQLMLGAVFPFQGTTTGVF